MALAYFFGLGSKDNRLSSHNNEQPVAGLHAERFPRLTRNNDLVLGGKFYFHSRLMLYIHYKSKVLVFAKLPYQADHYAPPVT